MSKVEIELNIAAVRAMLKSPEVAEACRGQIQRVAGMCGSGYEVDTYTGRNRVNAMIRAASPAAKRDNAKNGTIEKALEALKK